MHFDTMITETIPAFHALTGSDVTSYFSMHSKNTAWKVLEQNHQLLQNLGKGELTDETSKGAEQFICRLYKVHGVNEVDKACSLLFIKSIAPESLPPTSDT